MSKPGMVHHRVIAVLDSGDGRQREQERHLEMEIPRFCSSGSPGQLVNHCPGLPLEWKWGISIFRCLSCFCQLQLPSFILFHIVISSWTSRLLMMVTGGDLSSDPHTKSSGGLAVNHFRFLVGKRSAPQKPLLLSFGQHLPSWTDKWLMPIPLRALP